MTQSVLGFLIEKSLTQASWQTDSAYVLHFIDEEHYLHYYYYPLGGTIDQIRTLTMKQFKFYLATGLLLVHSHTYMVTRDALPLSHVQTIHRKCIQAHELRYNYIHV